MEEDAKLAAEEEGLDELIGADGGRVDAAELEVLLLEVGAVVRDARADVAGFGAEEEVENELNAVDLLQEVRGKLEFEWVTCNRENPLDPSVADALCNEAEDEG
jgi:hypothetical protein